MSNAIELDNIVRDGKESAYSLQVSQSGDAPNFKNEFFVSYFDGERTCVADIFFTVDAKTGEPKVYITADGDGDGDKKITVYPMRAAEKAVVLETT